jgi:hypothetical protein
MHTQYWMDQELLIFFPEMLDSLVGKDPPPQEAGLTGT